MRFYTDSYPLSALYRLDAALDRALGRTVWLRSGGYLVIEPTEAMTVIDVNTGKNTDKKTASETYLKTNLEAAERSRSSCGLEIFPGSLWWISSI